MDLSLETAAADLYASGWQTFRYVTLPLLLPGVIAGAMLAFVISLDDVVITEFAKSGGQDTCYLYAWPDAPPADPRNQCHLFDVAGLDRGAADRVLLADAQKRLTKPTGDDPMKKLLPQRPCCLPAPLASAEGALQLFNWGNYTSPELLAKFEAETGIKVTVTDYDSNDAALAKVEAGGSGFDLVVPSANYVPIWVEKGLIVPLDDSKLANKGNIAPEWKDVPWDMGRTHTIPWQWVDRMRSTPPSIRVTSTHPTSSLTCRMS